MPLLTIKTPEGAPIIHADIPHTAFGVDSEFCVVNVQEIRIIYEGPDAMAHGYTLGDTEGLLSSSVLLSERSTLIFPPGAFKIKLGGAPKEPT